METSREKHDKGDQQPQPLGSPKMKTCDISTYELYDAISNVTEQFQELDQLFNRFEKEKMVEK
jgi:hypothetical protein